MPNVEPKYYLFLFQWLLTTHISGFPSTFGNMKSQDIKMQDTARQEISSSNNRALVQPSPNHKVVRRLKFL